MHTCVSLPERWTDLYFWSELLRRDLLFFLLCRRSNLLLTELLFPPCFPHLSVTGFYFLLPDVLTKIPGEILFFTEQVFFILFPLRLLIGRDNRYVSLCPNQSVHAVWVSARTSVKLIASQHLLNGHVTRSMFLTLKEIFYIHNQK